MKFSPAFFKRRRGFGAEPHQIARSTEKPGKTAKRFFRTVITVPKQHLYYYIDYFRDRRFSAIHFRFLLVTKGLHFPKMALGLHFWEEGRK